MNQKILAQFSEAVRESTITRLLKIPDGFENWRISIGALSPAEIAKHLIAADQWLFQKLHDESFRSMVARINSNHISSRNEYIKFIDKLKVSGKRRANLIQNMTIKEFGKEIYDDRFKGKVTIWWVIVRGNLDHEIHHRGQLASIERCIVDRSG